MLLQIWFDIRVKWWWQEIIAHGQGRGLPQGRKRPVIFTQLPITRRVTVLSFDLITEFVLLPVVVLGAGVVILVIWQIVDSPGQREGGVARSGDLSSEPGEAEGGPGMGRGPGGARGVPGPGGGRGGRGQVDAALLTLTQPPTPAPAPTERVRGSRGLEIKMSENKTNKRERGIKCISELRKLTLSKVWAKLAKFSNSSARVMQADRTALPGLGMQAKTQDQGKFNFWWGILLQN